MQRESSRYIPFTVEEVTALCAGQFTGADRAEFAQFSRLLDAWYHHQFLSRTRTLVKMFEEGDQAFAETLNTAVQAANFAAITRADLDAALSEASVFELRVAVDFEDFEEIVFYRRGPSQQTAQVKRWFGLRAETIEFTSYELVLVYLRFRADRIPRGLEHAALLKLFKNVPKADLEMLFPNSQVRLRTLDKLLIGVPALFSGVAVVTTKIGGTLLLVGALLGFWLGLGDEPVTLDQSALVALLSGAGALGGYLWKQYSNFKNRKIRFMKTLTESLYFKTVADNEGVISYLMDQAEASEAKEALLAFTALQTLGPASAQEVARWVEQLLDRDLRFDVDDALDKLSCLGLLKAPGDDGGYEILSLAQSFAVVDKRWDDLFGAP